MKILVAGDYYPNMNLKQLIENRDYSFLDDVVSLTKQVDYSIVNFESPVVLGDYQPIQKCGPHLCSTYKAVEAIVHAGFNLVTLANNHIMDYGELGLNDTLETCSKYGIETVGVGKNLYEAYKVVYKEIDEKRIAIINCCEHEFSIATENTAGANPLNPIRQYYQIQEARENADYVLVIIHGGHEYFQLPSLRMVETYHFFVDVGADVVINHHQHCYSGYEVYKSKPIFYGLGNFCFDRKGSVNTPWNEGYLVELSLQDEEIKFKLHPYLQCNGTLKVEFLKDNIIWDNHLNKLNTIITDTKLLNNECLSFYSAKRRSMLMIFESYSNRFMSKLFRMGILPSFFRGSKKQFVKNMINCESHRDILLYNID